MTQEKLGGSTALRSCSPLLALQHLGVSSRDTYYYCLLSTSKVSTMVASQCKWVSSCSSSCPGTQSRSVEEKQEEPFVSEWLWELLQRKAECGDDEAGCESERTVGLLAELEQGLAPRLEAQPSTAEVVSQASALMALAD